MGGSTERQTILVVDDDTSIRDIVVTLLREEGYRVLAAATGVEALLILDGDEPALVITDMRMPLMDGWQLAAELRARYADRVPLLVMTAAVDATQRAGEVGAAGTISKPFDLDDLVRAVHHLIGPAEPASHVDGQQESRGA